jgi:hypothetical protein
VRLIEPVRKRLTIPCDIVSGDEAGILDKVGDADVLASMAFTEKLAAAGKRLRLVQVPGAGLDRIDRSQLRASVALAKCLRPQGGHRRVCHWHHDRTHALRPVNRRDGVPMPIGEPAKPLIHQTMEGPVLDAYLQTIDGCECYPRARNGRSSRSRASWASRSRNADQASRALKCRTLSTDHIELVVARMRLLAAHRPATYGSHRRQVGPRYC